MVREMTQTIYLGDCLEVMRSLPSNSVDAVVTDPPYSSGTRREGAKGLRKSMTRGHEDAAWFGTDSLTTNGFIWLMRACAVEWQRLLKPGGHALAFIDWRMMPAMAGAIESADLRHAGLLVWDKTYFGMGSCFRNQHELILHFTKGVGNPPKRRDAGNVFSFKPIRNGDHPTQKPLDLMRSLISVVAGAGETILDPFAGSGMTLAAGTLEGCNVIGIERDPTYHEIARQMVLDVQPGLPLQAAE
jgi:site-specific DNA-methyltransferase (adenine-specific)